MPRKRGDNAGGVRTAEDIRLRCHCDPDNGCWNWRMCSSKRGNAMAEQRVWLADERLSAPLPRAAWILGRKNNPLKPGEVVWRRCLNETCGNPMHMLKGTKAEWGAWASAKGYMRGRPERAIINRRIKIDSGQSRLTMELAQWIRESQQTGRAIAQALGESESVISRARKGHSFAPARVASIFAWRPAA